MKNELGTLLTNGLHAMDLKLSSAQQTNLVAYVRLLDKWNSVYNLTAVRAIDQMITTHILDSLSLLPFITSINSILDVGTGAGLPGIPLAIAQPECVFTLIDSQQKKINFVQHVITSLQLANVTATHHRIETAQISSQVDMIVSRAFASLNEFVKLIAHICNENTKIVAMKGKRDQVMQEINDLPNGFELVNIENLVVPGINAERCLVFLKKREGFK